MLAVHGRAVAAAGRAVATAVDFGAPLARFAAPALAWAGVGVPFDVVKTRLQTTSQSRFRSAWHCLAHTVSDEGALALWKGLTPQILISLPSSTLCLARTCNFDPSLRPLAPTADNSTPASSSPAAARASRSRRCRIRSTCGARGCRRRTATRRRRRPRPAGAARGAACRSPRFATCPGNGLFFFLHEWLDANVREKISGEDGVMSPALARMLCGGTTGVLYNLACSPFDVVRSRLMATADGGIASHARAVVAEHGWRGFLRGADVTVLKAFPTNAAGFLALSQAKRLLDVEDRY